MDLNLLMDQFLNEKLELGGMSLRLVSRSRLLLIGDTSTPLFNIGFVRFLKAIGIEHPELSDFDSHHVGRFWEFLTEHYGVLHSTNTMRALRGFWKWCVANQYIGNEKMPPDLVGKKVNHRFKVIITLKEPK